MTQEIIQVQANTGFMNWGPGDSYTVPGALTLTAGERKSVASAGDFVHIPCGTAHPFTKSGNSAAKILAIFSPPGMEGWFAAAFEAAADRYARSSLLRQEMLARMARHAPKYGVEFI